MTKTVTITLTASAVVTHDADDKKVSGSGRVTTTNDCTDWWRNDLDMMIRVRPVRQVGPGQFELVVIDMTNHVEPSPGYVKLTETNEWDGEQWAFYIPLTGNEAAIGELAAAITAKGADTQYELDQTPIPETTVDLLVTHANNDAGYMAAHNKLTGLLAVDETTLSKVGDEGDPLYKGGIKDFMEEGTPWCGGVALRDVAGTASSGQPGGRR